MKFRVSPPGKDPQSAKVLTEGNWKMIWAMKRKISLMAI